MFTYELHFKNNETYSISYTDEDQNTFDLGRDLLFAYYDFLSEEQIKEDIRKFNGYWNEHYIIHFNTAEDALNYIRYISDRYDVMDKLME